MPYKQKVCGLIQLVPTTKVSKFVFEAFYFSAIDQLRIRQCCNEQLQNQIL